MNHWPLIEKIFLSITIPARFISIHHSVGQSIANDWNYWKLIEIPIDRQESSTIGLQLMRQHITPDHVSLYVYVCVSPYANFANVPIPCTPLKRAYKSCSVSLQPISYQDAPLPDRRTILPLGRRALSPAAPPRLGNRQAWGQLQVRTEDSHSSGRGFKPSVWRPYSQKLSGLDKSI